MAASNDSEKESKGTATPEPVERPSGQSEPGFPIVGIGASAGGLAAFEAFFSGMPADSDPGMAFVLVQHLAPDHKSSLSSLVKRYTRMQVFEVADGMTVKPNCAYIIPPNRDMALLHGTLRLLEPAAPRGQRLPIDFFFRSLAEDQHERAICIVLSGTGSDGTLGVRAVKGEGGMVMAQTPESTEYDGMPRSVIATGLADYVLPPAEMPARLIAFAAHAFGKASRPASHAAPHAEDDLQKIFLLLRAQTGHDFSQYKRNTILRRMERRMAVHQIDHLESFVRYLQQAPANVEALFNDLLIGVTCFFRDRAAFEALEEEGLPRLFSGRREDTWIRVWVPACSTGEEAYSIAILLQERVRALRQNFKLQVFATDIDRHALACARAGVYPASIAADVPPDRLAHFFTPEPDGSAYRVRKSVRDVIVFSEQNVIKDPPFSGIDLISCRNLLIYMGPELQKRIIAVFHYALKASGLLFLGTSETIGEFSKLFTSIDHKAKIYYGNISDGRPTWPGVAPFILPAPVPLYADKMAGGSKRPVRELTERALLDEYAPVGVLVNEHGEILYLHGRTGQYLEPAPGEAALNILKMAREGLRRELTTALHKAVVSKEPVYYPHLLVKAEGAFATVNLRVRPVSDGPDAAATPPLFLVIFEPAPAMELQLHGETAGKGPDGATGAFAADSNDSAARITALQEELRAKEEYIETFSEEVEASYEELRSANEEMQSMNEELQSTNEELETSKEELQSINEELSTVNTELQTKVADLSRSNDDMNNLLAGTGIGTIFVDHRLRIQRFTPAVTQIINLRESDVGRPVGHITSNLMDYDRLVADITAVLDNLEPREIEVQNQSGRWYLLRIRPYRTLENVIEGAVITFTDVTEMNEARESLREADAFRRLAVIVRDARDAITVQDVEGHILAWNPGAVRLYGWSEAEAMQMNIRDTIPEGGREEALAHLQQQSRAISMEPYRMQRLTKEGRGIEVTVTASALLNEAGNEYAIVTTERGGLA